MSFHDDETVPLESAAQPGPAAGLVNIPRVLGPVRLIREIGRGGMGEVWLGRHSLLARDVAVKFLINAVLGPDDLHFERFLQEARTAAAVRHPHLVVVHDADLVGQVPYLVMEYIDGPTLAEVLRQRGPLTVPKALAVLEGVGAAVGELHQRGIVHRDIKPSNILLARDGRVVVSDFGLACTSTPRRDDAPFAALAGTPAYMAPEMFDGTATPRSDVYALGVTLCQLLTGEPPFIGTLEELRQIHLSHALPDEKLAAQGVDVAVIDILHRATNKNATLRYKSAAHLLRALKEAVPDERLWARGAAELVNEAVRRRPMSAPESAIDVKTPSSLSYYDHLSGIAATKRERLSEGVPIEPGPQARAPSGAVMVDLPCTTCAYNLRGLPGNGACPECGMSIGQSLRPERLMFADPIWLSQVRSGLVVAGWAGLSATLVTFFRGFAVGWLYDVLTGFRVAAVVALIVGVFLATTPEMRWRPGQRGPVSRRWARAAVWLAAFAWLISVLRIGPPFSQGIRLAFSLPALTCAAALMQYLRTLGRRIPDRRIVRHSTETNVVLPLAVSMFCIAVLGEIVTTGALDPTSQWRTILVVTKVLALWVLIFTLPWISLKLLGIAPAIERQIAGHVKRAAVFGSTGLLESSVTGPASGASGLGAEILGTVTLTSAASSTSAPSVHRRELEWLRLKNCPKCEYSLEGLPRRYRCPECGFEYDESMFVLYGWMRAENRPSGWTMLGAFSPAVSVLIFSYGLIPVLTSTPRTWRWQDGVFVALCVMAGLGVWLWRRRQRQQHGGAIQLAFSSAGASKRRGPGPGEFIPWSEFRRVRFKRVGRDVWRLRLSYSRWHLVTYGTKPYTLTGRPWIEGVIECSRREAAVIRGELRRRLRAARG